MGIRFKCHLCESPLHVKSDLASKRGVCPKCHGKFRIPASSQAYSIDLSVSISSAGSSRRPETISSATTFDHQPVANVVNKSDKGIDPISKVASSAKRDQSHGVSINGTHEHLSKKETEQVKEEAASKVEGSLTTTSAKRKQVDEQARKQRAGESPAESSAIIESDIAPLLEKSKESGVEEPFYFVRPPSGGEYGPASKSVLEEWIAQRRVTPDSLVCRLGESDWLKAKDVFAVKFIFMKE